MQNGSFGNAIWHVLHCQTGHMAYSLGISRLQARHRHCPDRPGSHAIGG